jgi:hypothetical protein
VTSPTELYNVATLALGDEFPMNSWPTSENPQKAKFAEILKAEVHAGVEVYIAPPHSARTAGEEMPTSSAIMRP